MTWALKLTGCFFLQGITAGLCAAAVFGAAIGGLAFLVVKACNISSSKNHTADPLKVSHSVEVEKEKISNPINYKVKEAYKAAYASVKGLFCKPAAGSGDDHKSQEGLTHTK